MNNNLYFLLLGLGVDDAFVLTSEFLTHSREAKEKDGVWVHMAEDWMVEYALFGAIWSHNVT